MTWNADFQKGFLTVRDLFRQFRHDKRGNFAVIFGLSLLPMLGMVGLATDYASALRAKAALDASVDAAVFAGTTAAAQVINSQSTPTFDATALAIAQGKARATLAFNANAGRLVATTHPSFSIEITRPGNALSLNAVASYTATSPNTIGSMFGSNAMNIAGQSGSSTTLPKYINVYIAIDISQSMGIASTSAGMTQLFQVTANTKNQGGGCVFGCHVTNGSQKISNETLAENNNIQLRIDVIRQSVINMIQTAQAQAGSTPRIKLGIYTLQYDATPLPNTWSAPTTDYNGLTTTAKQIELGPNNSSGVGDSNFSTALGTLATLVPQSGTGSSATDAQNYVFIMTDGVSDVKGNCTSGHCTAAFDPALCTPFKNKSASVGVIYTTYLPIYQNGIDASSGFDGNYKALVYPFSTNIAPNLKKCASSANLYYEASEGPAIAAAIQQLFASATNSSRLTQ